MNQLTPCKVGPKRPSADGYVKRYDLERQQTRNAHTMVWEEAFGPLPAGMQVHHLCENQQCLNVDHLVALTAQQHIALHAISNKRAMCPKGHLLTEDNRKRNGYTKAGAVKYTCRKCANENLRRRYKPKQTKLARTRRAMKAAKAAPLKQTHLQQKETRQ